MIRRTMTGKPSFLFWRNLPENAGFPRRNNICEMNGSQPLTVHFFLHPGLEGGGRGLWACNRRFMVKYNPKVLLCILGIILVLLPVLVQGQADAGAISRNQCVVVAGTPSQFTSIRDVSGTYLNYYWERATVADFSTATIVATNQQQFQEGALAGAAGTIYYYRRRVDLVGGGQKLSNIIKVTMVAATANPTFTVNFPATDLNVCQGSNALIVNYTTTANEYVIVWSTTAVNNGFSDQSGTLTPGAGNTLSVNIPTTAAPNSYTGTLIATATATGCALDNAAPFTIKPLPNATISGSTTVCLNTSSPSITFTGSNATAPYTFTYKINGGANQTVATTSGNSTTVTVPTSGAGSFAYSLVSVQESSSKTCTKTVSGTATVVVSPLPTATVSGTTPVCQNTTSSITFTGASGTAPYTFTYKLNTGANQTVTTSSGNAVSVTVPTGAAGSFTYSLVSVSDGSTAACSNTASGTTTVTVNPTPATPTPTNGGAVCVGTSLQLTTATLSGATYAWTGPNGFSSSIQNPTVPTTSTAANGTYSLTVTVNGCTSAVSSTAASVFAIPATPTVTINGPVCLGSSLNLGTASVTGATYAWTGPNSFSAVLQNPVISSLTAAATGTYAVRVTVNNCTSAAGSAPVTVNTLPNATITASGATTFCNGGSVTLTAAGGISYLWSTGAVLPAITVTNSGTITATATDANGCKANATPITVTVNPLPNLVINNPAAVCAPGTVNLTAAAVTAGSTTGTSFTYFTDAATSIPFTTPTTTAVAGTYYIKGTLPTGCSSSRAVTVVITNLPSLTVQNPAAACAPQTVNLTSPNITQGSDNGLLYTYFTDAALTAVVPNPAAVLSSGVYYIRANAPASACFASMPVTVVVHPAPTGVLQTPAVNYICSGSSLQLNAVDGFAYQWLLNQTPITGATNADYAATAAGVYSVRFISPQGCVREATNTLRIDQLVKPTLRLQLNSRCAATPISFSNLSTYSNSGSINWLWDFGDGASANSFSPTHTYTAGGNYSVSLTANNLSCPSFSETISTALYIDSARVPVRYPTVKAVAGKAFPLSARSLGALYRWLPATGLNSTTVQSPMATLNNDLEYTVSITNSASCTTTDTVAIKLVFDGNIFVGNGFTPNGDGVNDRCYPILSGVRSLVYFKIYNRWGNLVFQTNDASPQNGWDGKYMGRLQSVGTYTWVAEAVDGKGNIFKQNGNVLLIN